MKRVLIANRGEIAVRVIKTCRNLGIETVSIFAEDDRELPHAKKADFSICIGDGALKDTYLNIEKIIKVAKELKVDAIHPGYGFLSENADFSSRLEEDNILFIGPRADSIKLMGDKIRSKQEAEKLGVPIIPGYHGDKQNNDFLEEEAKKIGLPLLIKASAGGGGKGMRVVRDFTQFQELLASARSEALKSFGDDKVLLERYIEKPRHIEVQVFGDGKGNAIHFFERECSLQRRHQKVIEESPSPSLTNKKRLEICDSAVKLAKGINYRGAGTVEFIYNNKGEFFFLEMNTRLQVEHPVTEMTTGYDLVKLQIQIAKFEKIEVKQEEISSRGYSLECRIYAEDPYNNFFPESGRLEYIGASDDPDVRMDIGYENGNEVGINYDPMIAKLIVRGEDRKHAIGKMIQAIDDYPFLGIKTNRTFLKSLIKRKNFLDGDYYTNYIEENIEELTEVEKLDKLEDLDDFLAAFFYVQGRNNNTIQGKSYKKKSPWSSLSEAYR